MTILQEIISTTNSIAKIELQECENMQLLNIQKFKLSHINIDDGDPWYGDFIEIVFHNKSRLHCDVKQIKESISL